MLQLVLESVWTIFNLFLLVAFSIGITLLLRYLIKKRSGSHK